jgi:hypothetical protein
MCPYGIVGIRASDPLERWTFVETRTGSNRAMNKAPCPALPIKNLPICILSLLSAFAAAAAAAGARVSSTPASSPSCCPPASYPAAYKRLPATRPLSDDELIGAMFKSHDKRTSEK